MSLNIAIEGCCHGELDDIYDTIQFIQSSKGVKVDVLLICGDFQSCRNAADLACMACPDKYKKMNTFYKYYSGEKVAPVLTIFIGGNHEASNYLQELYYGGWVAPNIYYLGAAGVVNVNGIRIGGLSGIYNANHFANGYPEQAPYNNSSMRSIYHVRQYEVMKLMQLNTFTQPLDIFLSHDWPTGIAFHGDKELLFKKKSFLREEVMDGSLGNPSGQRILQTLQPEYWFSAHLHVKFSAVVNHPGTPSKPTPSTTKFLSLDKCMSGKDFLQVMALKLPAGQEKETTPVLRYDAEWLCIVKKTHFMLTKNHRLMLAPELQASPLLYQCTEAEVSDMKTVIVESTKDSGMAIPLSFQRTVPAYIANQPILVKQPHAIGNPQTDLFLAMMHLPHVITLPWGSRGMLTPGAMAGLATNDLNEIDLEDIEEDDEVLVEATAIAPTITNDINEIDLDDLGEEDEEIVLQVKKRSILSLPPPTNSNNSSNHVTTEEATDDNEIDLDDL